VKTTNTEAPHYVIFFIHLVI